IGVIFGGTSGEHDISLLTARGVLGAIDATRYEVVPIGISKSGRWAGGDDVLERLSRAAEVGLDQAEPDTSTDSIGAMSEALSLLSNASVDAVFPLLHGPMGEDGTLQGLLEFCGVPYVGCGVAASAVAMDKGLAKDVFRSNSIPTLPWTMVQRGRWQGRRERVLADLESSFAYPLFVKPANLGSSVGISKAGNREQLATGLDLAARYDERLLVEPGIDAREIEIAILGNSDPQASVPGEIRPRREFYDYKAKYFDDATELIVPAVLDETLTDQLQTLAIQSFEALACAGLARVDFLLERGTNKAWISEVNTMPGFTESSMYPRLWEASGISYGELIDRLLGLALELRGGGVV
ncbi:MAG: D-alanine--D-alanine ligase, partial [Rhodospirillaceae bacterium]|nr:D-alanine--D-alanine ligase [Rhodospirillaceae bacterium]